MALLMKTLVRKLKLKRNPHIENHWSLDYTLREHKNKRKRRQRKDLAYSEPELPVPTVSSSGVGGNRMNYYARAFPCDYGQAPYFCPSQSSRNLSYERTMRASSYYQPNSIDKAEI